MENNSSQRESETTHSPTTTTLLVPAADNGPGREVILSTSQQQALEYLLSGGSITKAAKVAGVTRQTISRWIREDLGFQAVYEAWHREIQKSLKDRMLTLGDSAMDNFANAIRLKGNLRASEFVLKHLLGQKTK